MQLSNAKRHGNKYFHASLNRLTMIKCYKIITPVSYFKYEFNIDDIFAIPAGSVFTAHRYQCDEYSCAIKSDFPVIHFADNAIDAVFWCHIMSGPKPVSAVAIYEITPLSQPILKEKCKDHNGRIQCGAEKIRIDKQISFRELRSLAFDLDYFRAVRAMRATEQQSQKTH